MGSNHKFLKCGLLNIQSITNKGDEIRERIDEHSMDILVLCETWLSDSNIEGNLVKIKGMLPTSHTFYHIPRKQKRGGGVGIFLSKVFTQIRMIKTQMFSTFEYLNINFNTSTEKLKFIVVYRPDGSHPTFREEFQTLMDTLVGEKRKTFICGDFNYWVDSSRSDAAMFLEIMDNFNFTNHVTVPTARAGHSLDLIFSDKDICTTKNLQVEFDDPAVHKLVTCELNLMINKKIKRTISFRDKSNLQPDLLISVSSRKLDSRRLESCECDHRRPPPPNKADCSTCLASIYNETLRSSYEDMCPMRNKEIIIRDRAPWYNTTIGEARKRRRKCEKEWRRRRTTASRTLYTQAKNDVNKLIKETKEQYYRAQTRESKGDMKKISALFNDLLGKSTEITLPDFTPDLAQNFADFFEEKIDNIYNSLGNQGTGTDILLPDFPFSKLSQFEPMCLTYYKGLVKNTKNSYCENDPLPFGDLMNATNIDDLLKVQLDIINSSFANGVFPKSEKNALIKPTIKNNSDIQNLTSYRPVSNLTFLSKMIEVAALQQLNEHLDMIKILPETQSAYRKHHSTETALCTVVDDLLQNRAKGKCSLLILLDLSAAFDTVVHELLIEDLEAIGIEGTALKWFKSYLTERSFQVSVKNTLSRRKLLEKGVPQGSVLGPILFCIYTLGLAWILHRYGINFQFYADDTQFYFSVTNVADSQALIDQIMADTANWMRKKRLKLNESKTECLLIGSNYHLRRHSDFNVVSINGTLVPLSAETRNLGVIFDRGLTMNSQISSVVKSCNFQLRNIALIKQYLDQDCLKMLVTNLVITRVDYCNSLYNNLPKKQLRRLQNVLNRAARLVTGHAQWSRIRVTPLLIDLHWLPIKARIVFKICVLAHLALRTGVPGYLNKKLQLYTRPAAQTRNANNPHRLEMPRTNRNISERAFSYSAPRLYNQLPSDIKESANIVTFKKKLKTHLFGKCYDLQDKTITEAYAID